MSKPENNELHGSPCTLGMNCDHFGACYAKAQGDISQCGRIASPTQTMPVEPTDEMIAKGALAAYEHSNYPHKDLAQAIYRAMVSAASPDREVTP